MHALRISPYTYTFLFSPTDGFCVTLLLFFFVFRARGSVCLSGRRIPTATSPTRGWAVAPLQASPAASLLLRPVLLVSLAATTYPSRLSVPATAMPGATLVLFYRSRSSVAPAAFSPSVLWPAPTFVHRYCVRGGSIGVRYPQHTGLAACDGSPSELLFPSPARPVSIHWLGHRMAPSGLVSSQVTGPLRCCQSRAQRL